MYIPAYWVAQNNDELKVGPESVERVCQDKLGFRLSYVTWNTLPAAVVPEIVWRPFHWNITMNITAQYILYSGGSTGGSGGVRTPPPLMGQHPISRDPTSPDFVLHKCKISYLKFLNKLILLL